MDTQSWIHNSPSKGSSLQRERSFSGAGGRFMLGSPNPAVLRDCLSAVQTESCSHPLPMLTPTGHTEAEQGGGVPITQVLRVPEESSRGLCSRQMVSTQSVSPIRGRTQERGTKALSLIGGRHWRLRDTSGACPAPHTLRKAVSGRPWGLHRLETYKPQTHRLPQELQANLN